MRAVIAGLGLAVGLTAGWLLWGRPVEVTTPPVAPAVDTARIRAEGEAAATERLGDSLATLAQRLAYASRPRPAAPLPPRPVAPDALPAYVDTLEARLGAAVALGDTLRGELARAAVSVREAADSARAAAGRLRALASDLADVAQRARDLESERDGLARQVRRLTRPVRVGVGGLVAGTASDAVAIGGGVVEVRRPVLFLEVRLAGVAGYGVGSVGTPGPAGAVVGSVGF